MATTDPAGSLVAHYRLLEPLGAGAAGAVYRAVDTRLERTVAIKVLHAAYGSDPVSRQRFAREAQAASHLDHPNICTVYEFGETGDGRLFLALAYYPGETLATRLARGRLAAVEAIGVAAQVADALHHAHLRHVVHRDVKPANVLLARSDHGTTAKVLDFGLAKLEAAADLTHAGGLLGSPAYMAPEQIRGQFVDHRADLWSLGVILWEMLAGERPFRADSLTALFFLITQQPPPDPQTLECPQAVRTLLAQLLAHDPARRPATASAVADVLRGANAAIATRSPTSDHTETLLSGAPRPPGALAGTSGASTPAAHSRGPGLPPLVPSLAILPFVDLSGSGSEDPFAAGLSEELIWALSQTRRIRVASRSVAAQAQRAGLDARAAGQSLGTSHVLEGSVRRAGERLRITVHLVATADGLSQLARRFDCEQQDLLQVQEDIARELVAALEVELYASSSTPITRPQSADPEAYRLFLRGRAAWQKRTLADLRASIGFFDQALARDPLYALAHAARADALVLLAGPYGADPPAPGMAAARRAAEDALRLEPRLAEAHAVLGSVHCFFDWDPARAEDALRRALALDERYATAHQGYAMVLLMRCEFDAARSALERAAALDPASHAIATSRGLVEFCRGRPEDAIRLYQAMLETDDGFALGWLFLGEALAATAQLQPALAALARAEALDPESVEILAARAQAEAQTGDHVRARDLLSQLEARARDHYVSAYRLAQIRLALGERGAALDLLERARAERAAELVWLRARQAFAALRDQPRYRAVEEAVCGPQRAS